MRSPSLAAARAAEARAASFRPTPEDKRRRIKELEERAHLYGDSHPTNCVSLFKLCEPNARYCVISTALRRQAG